MFRVISQINDIIRTRRPLFLFCSPSCFNFCPFPCHGMYLVYSMSFDTSPALFPSCYSLFSLSKMIPLAPPFTAHVSFYTFTCCNVSFSSISFHARNRKWVGMYGWANSDGGSCFHDSFLFCLSVRPSSAVFLLTFL